MHVSHSALTDVTQGMSGFPSERKLLMLTFCTSRCDFIFRQSELIKGDLKINTILLNVSKDVTPPLCRGSGERAGVHFVVTVAGPVLVWQHSGTRAGVSVSGEDVSH